MSRSSWTLAVRRMCPPCSSATIRASTTVAANSICCADSVRPASTFERAVCELAAGQQAEIEESGWKMVSGDVFRTPKEPLLLCVEVGSGVQICTSAFITLLFAALGE